MKQKVTCDWCRKVFERSTGDIKKHNYCSKVCLGKANGERLRKDHTKVCDNCGKKFISRDRHGSRNRHHFCSRECGWNFKIKQILVRCDWCGKLFKKKRSDIARSGHNFCSHGCYLDYINLQCAGSKNQRVCGEVLYRYLAGKKMGRELTTQEEVHHRDGNHFNNAIDNLSVVSKSEHARIHAARKERDSHGRFVKAR